MVNTKVTGSKPVPANSGIAQSFTLFAFSPFHNYRSISIGRRRDLESCKCRFESCFLYKGAVRKIYFGSMFSENIAVMQ